MTDRQRMLADLRRILGASSVFWPNRNAKLDDLYETNVWSLVAPAAAAKGWHVAYANTGPTGREFTFRRGPGRLTPASRYSFARLTRGGRQLEVHVGVRVQGQSGVLHEFDIAALTAAECRRARSGRGDPRWSGARLHLECKYHSNDLNLGTARALLGLGLDCPDVRPHLVSKLCAPDSIRTLVRYHRATYVHYVFPAFTGGPYLDTCLEAALR